MPDGNEIGLPTYLEKVWEVVGRTALENVLGAAEAKARNGLAGALEEDARLTALALVRAERERGRPDFMRLSNALSALYPRGSEEKRLVDAMLLAAPNGVSNRGSWDDR